MASKMRNGVRLLFTRVPYNKNAPAGTTVARFSDVADQFTDNPNPLYDPSQGAGSVKEVSVASVRKSANKPGKASRGHQKVISPNRLTLFGGKRLRRF
jgi:hypothetical protein